MAEKLPTESWSVKKLKVYIRTGGGSIRGCVGKADLVRKAQQVRHDSIRQLLRGPKPSFLSTSLSKEELFDRIAATIEKSKLEAKIRGTPVFRMVVVPDSGFWRLHHRFDAGEQIQFTTCSDGRDRFTYNISNLVVRKANGIIFERGDKIVVPRSFFFACTGA